MIGDVGSRRNRRGLTGHKAEIQRLQAGTTLQDSECCPKCAATGGRLSRPATTYLAAKAIQEG